ncbi:MAG: 50S ribosomal protein L15 [Dehalococcoidia bacterium]|nr:50S ribosomal protein L15 [Dehalococcoidia bacterium]
MRLHDLKPAPGSKKQPKRLGQGHGSGTGTYSGRGNKGQKARSGGGVRRGFEGGQLPLIRRMPRKRGFVNLFRVEYQIIKIGQLERFEANAQITPDLLEVIGLIADKKAPIKVLGDGILSKSLTVTADKFSASAAVKIQAAGGKTLGRGAGVHEGRNDA